jgi:hypothetical protein
MRPVSCALLLIVVSTSAAFATAEVTIISHFDQRHSERAVNEMKRELQDVMHESSVELSWRSAGDISPAESFANLVVVTFHGSCETRPFTASLPDEAVALGYSHVSSGQVIPFAEVECDRIRSELRTTHVMVGPEADRLLGRAMGRVLAHELHHIIGHTSAHTHTGIFRKSLSPQDLVADRNSSSSLTR